MTQSVKIGWKRLEKILNDTIIKELNLQKPIKGDGISLNQTASGTIISTTKRGGDKQDQQGGNAPSKVYIQYTQWKQVTLVDPATCQQSTTYFLEFIPDSTYETQFNVTVNDDGTWTLAIPTTN